LEAGDSPRAEEIAKADLSSPVPLAPLEPKGPEVAMRQPALTQGNYYDDPNANSLGGAIVSSYNHVTGKY
jgi:hypothetical protein